MSQTNSILSLLRARSCMIRLARSVSRRCTSVDLAGEAGEEGRLLQRAVAAADHDDLLVAEEEAVAGRAPGHAAAGEPVLAGDAQRPVRRAHGQHDGAGAVRRLPHLDDLDLAGQVDLGRVVGDELGAEALGLLAQVVHELGPHDAVREAGVVLDVGGVHERAAGGHRALEHQRSEPGAGQVDGGGVAGRPEPMTIASRTSSSVTRRRCRSRSLLLPRRRTPVNARDREALPVRPGRQSGRGDGTGSTVRAVAGGARCLLEVVARHRECAARWRTGGRGAGLPGSRGPACRCVSRSAASPSPEVTDGGAAAARRRRRGTCPVGGQLRDPDAASSGPVGPAGGRPSRPAAPGSAAPSSPRDDRQGALVGAQRVARAQLERCSGQRQVDGSPRPAPPACPGRRAGRLPA